MDPLGQHMDLLEDPLGQEGKASGVGSGVTVPSVVGLTVTTQSNEATTDAIGRLGPTVTVQILPVASPGQGSKALKTAPGAGVAVTVTCVWVLYAEHLGCVAVVPEQFMGAPPFTIRVPAGASVVGVTPVVTSYSKAAVAVLFLVIFT